VGLFWILIWKYGFFYLPLIHNQNPYANNTQLQKAGTT